MDYYKRRALAAHSIKLLLEKGIEHKAINMEILQKFGLGDKFTDKVINDLQALGW